MLKTTNKDDKSDKDETTTVSSTETDTTGANKANNGNSNAVSFDIIGSNVNVNTAINTVLNNNNSGVDDAIERGVGVSVGVGCSDKDIDNRIDTGASSSGISINNTTNTVHSSIFASKQCQSGLPLSSPETSSITDLSTLSTLPPTVSFSSSSSTTSSPSSSFYSSGKLLSSSSQQSHQADNHRSNSGCGDEDHVQQQPIRPSSDCCVKQQCQQQGNITFGLESDSDNLSKQESSQPQQNSGNDTASVQLLDDNVDNDDGTVTLSSTLPPSKQRTTTKDELKRSKQESKQLRRLERRRSRQPVHTYWHALPIDLLERIFRLLSIKERHVASQVCPHWFECFYTPYAWSTFVLTDITLTKRKYNYYLGYQRIIDPYRTQLFLHRFGHCIRRLIITPMENFYNLYEFMKIISYYAQFFKNNPLHNLYMFDFTFGCHFSNVESGGVQNSSSRGPRHLRHLIGEQGQRQFNNNQEQNNNNGSGEFVFGTGGKLLEALQALISQLTGLKTLALRNLLLDPHEAQHLLDDVTLNCYDRLRTLTLINCCKRPFAFLHTGIFLNLETLIISCQHLNEDVLSLLAYTKLRNLYLVQNEFTNSVPTLPKKVWRDFCRQNSKIHIHLALVNNLFDSKDNDFAVKQLVYQEATITSIIFDSAYIPIRHTRLLDAIELYSDSLECLAFYQLPKFYMIKSYTERADTLLIYLSESCPNLNTLIVRELISTSTLLILVTYGRNLTRLLIRRNAIRKRFDCSRNPKWTDEFWNWLAKTSRSYEATFQAVSQKLGYRWQPLTDEQFKRVRPDVEL